MSRGFTIRGWRSSAPWPQRSGSDFGDGRVLKGIVDHEIQTRSQSCLSVRPGNFFCARSRMENRPFEFFFFDRRTPVTTPTPTLAIKEARDRTSSLTRYAAWESPWLALASNSPICLSPPRQTCRGCLAATKSPGSPSPS